VVSVILISGFPGYRNNATFPVTGSSRAQRGISGAGAREPAIRLGQCGGSIDPSLRSG
jgi:hypothetical protein